MGRELKLEEIEFDDIIEEISVVVFGNYYEDEDGNTYESWDHPDYNSSVEEIDVVYSHGADDEYSYTYMTHIFKYKDRYFSILKCEDSYGDSGFETDTLKEVFPTEKTITVYC